MLHTLDRLRLRTPRGADVPLATVADGRFTKAPSFVERNARAGIIRIVRPSYLSVFGMLGLAGVAVSDSIMLVDHLYQRRAEGKTLREAALEAGARRFRPILLTATTTFAGLAPLMSAKSLQAHYLIPMAISLGFGILFCTVITLYLVPCALRRAEDLGRHLGRFHERLASSPPRWPLRRNRRWPHEA